MLQTPSEFTPPLRRAGYFIAMATTFVQVAEVFLRAWPFRLFSPAWRISLVSSATSIAPTVLLMMFVLIAIAMFAGDRRLSLMFSGFAFLAAICFSVLSGAFMLDSIQIRNQVQLSVTRKFDITALWTLFRVLMGLVGFLLLAVAGLRSATAIGQQTARDTKKVGTLIIGDTSTAGPRVGESAEVKGA